MAETSIPRKRRPQDGANVVDMTGQTFGLLTVIRRVGSRRSDALWLCLCACGRERTTTRACLRAGYSKSCGCSRRKPRQNYTCHLAPGEAARRNVIKQYKGAARKRELAWLLDEAEAYSLIEQSCFYCGTPPARIRKVSRNGEFAWNGLDRVDNSIGYVSGNVVPCCHICNHAKCDMSREEFVAWAERIAKHLFG